ncbi:hypothetical protein G6O67_001114 [Ophiocordyceps sinensis]|uniref:Uncharacterized protein n=1 Tax=Ophiocordyceps sinensis TaxID=72228 RepID=A0A8H4PWT5_9HYPO|nr:hypothetical protein G6O67_001114 [Ophiocordyceps sinensis]
MKPSKHARRLHAIEPPVTVRDQSPSGGKRGLSFVAIQDALATHIYGQSIHALDRRPCTVQGQISRYEARRVLQWSTSRQGAKDMAGSVLQLVQVINVLGRPAIARGSALLDMHIPSKRMRVSCSTAVLTPGLTCSAPGKFAPLA